MKRAVVQLICTTAPFCSSLYQLIFLTSIFPSRTVSKHFILLERVPPAATKRLYRLIIESFIASVRTNSILCLLSLIQVVNGILSFGRCKLLTVFRSKLVIDCAFRHRHSRVILLCFCKSVCVPVYACHIINSILCCIRWKSFTIRRCQLVINCFL